MTFKVPQNPEVFNLTTSIKSRSVCLEYLRAVKVGDYRFCAWCATGQLKSKIQKYCTTECKNSAWAWAYPQSEYGLGMLLIRQNFKCRICEFSFEPALDELRRKELESYPGVDAVPHYKEKFIWYYFKRLKYSIEPERKPEVDHIVPIFKGGVSIGLDNHQAICRVCHRDKTAKDKRKIKGIK